MLCFYFWLQTRFPLSPCSKEKSRALIKPIFSLKIRHLAFELVRLTARSLFTKNITEPENEPRRALIGTQPLKRADWLKIFPLSAENWLYIARFFGICRGFECGRVWPLRPAAVTFELLRNRLGMSIRPIKYNKAYFRGSHGPALTPRRAGVPASRSLLLFLTLY